jgi:hypothetical protein
MCTGCRPGLNPREDAEQSCLGTELCSCTLLVPIRSRADPTRCASCRGVIPPGTTVKVTDASGTRYVVQQTAGGES